MSRKTKKTRIIICSSTHLNSSKNSKLAFNIGKAAGLKEIESWELALLEPPPDIEALQTISFGELEGDLVLPYIEKLENLPKNESTRLETWKQITEFVNEEIPQPNNKIIIKLTKEELIALDRISILLNKSIEIVN